MLVLSSRRKSCDVGSHERGTGGSRMVLTCVPALGCDLVCSEHVCPRESRAAASPGSAGTRRRGTPFVAGESWRVSECWHSDGDDDEKSAGQESPLADGATQADNVPKHGLIRISGSIGTWLLLTGVEKRIGRGAAKAWDILAIWRWEAVMRGWCLM